MNKLFIINLSVHTHLNMMNETQTNITSLQFEFEGHTGTNYHGDMALDDITIHAGDC